MQEQLDLLATELFKTFFDIANNIDCQFIIPIFEK